ncbi:MAG: SRPBCC domain-containing protein [Salibacteraceae bacterium]
MKDFYTEVYINASSEKVWQAFVAPQQFFMAFYRANISSTFEIGDRIAFVGSHEGQEMVHSYGEVLGYEPGKLLSYTEHPGPSYQENHQEMTSRVTVNITPVGEATCLTLSSDQFSANNPMREAAEQWYLILSNLKTWVETGQLMTLPN